ncbi:8-amino-7-oxononanoate synthase [Marinomonas mediterranea]|uniref:8-amino-7-oxononanoate synthase n=1 Tax=Marinomonas mediterranea TaxID=119864 RepID=UPI00234ACC5D|nr:8-amino-7-oxononanoate synthase [Marinomonas mediterranea]
MKRLSRPLKVKRVSKLNQKCSMMPVRRTLPDWIITTVEERKSANLYRQIEVLNAPQSVSPVIEGKAFLSFCSNDYLGLASHPTIVKALAEGAERYGVGSGSAHLVCGHLSPHDELERALCDWLGVDRVMLFSTGYMANLAVLSALGRHCDTVIQDKLNHASLIDGAKLSETLTRRYLHADLQSAKKLIDKQSRPTLLVSDGIFSMDGDIAPLKGLLDLLSESEHLFVVDDAHGLGCMGSNGLGSLSLSGLSASSVSALIGTFGKGFGTAGAFVACSHEMAEYLTQFARPYIYTTAMSPAMAYATKVSLELIRSEEGERLRHRLVSNIELFKQRMHSLDLVLMPSSSAIQPVMIGSSARAIELSALLRNEGILCTAIRPPTVPNNQARLRITLSAAHSHNDIHRLCDTLERFVN